MMDASKLPEGYEPFQTLEICGNHLVNVRILVEVKKQATLLIGKGKYPLVWLCGLASKDSTYCEPLIEENKPLYDVIEVHESYEPARTIVRTKQILVIDVYKATEEKAVVTAVDLRPIGLQIYGNEECLYVGTDLLKGNTFTNVHTMIGIG